MILDTETISVDKRFIYDIGYIIAERVLMAYTTQYKKVSL